uniref:Uncharacterized protein n=1 Tax=Pseudictyota dubia TaxID=2749911 RepID=A0A6U2DQB0_9STRA|mmetsp:Transcript_31153/g.57566  ORF Transcript_31153/g.57566 Transcript_31153/m.57566 type:complete len:110 (+) Transcript_31153:155-484(+)
MSAMRTIALLTALFACSNIHAGAFIPRPRVARNVVLRMCPGGNDEEDPTKVWYAGIADGIQNILTNSPLNEGKKALVRSLAGDYDREAIRAKLEGLINDHPVLMLSFVK